MEQLTFQHCFHHGARAAAARCPECGRFFCRECVTEHDDRVLCKTCIVKLRQPADRRSRRFAGLIRLLQFSAGLLLIWFFFYYTGRVLMKIPAAFHEGSIWRMEWWEGR